MLPKRLDPRVIADLTDSVEERISKKVKADFKSEMILMKSDMITEIMSALGGIPGYMGTKDSYEEVVEDFEVVGSSGRGRIDQVERTMGNRAGQFDRSGSQLKLKHKMEVSNFLGTLNPEDLIDWIGELEDYF